MIIKPPRFIKGQEIGIIAPAGPIKEFDLKPSINLLSAFSRNIILSPHLFDRSGYTAGDDRARLDDLHSMLDNRNIKIIFCARGGYGTLRLLDRIDYERIQRHPKIIVGYSDITALLLAIHRKTGLVTFHGPVVTELTKNSNRNLNAFFDLVSSGESLRMNLAGGIVLAPGKARGILLGGNLSLISHLIGTPYMPSLKGVILIMEDIGEQVYRIDRMLTHLKLSGHLDELQGVIIGEFVDCGERSIIDALFMDILADLSIPVVSGLPIGHGTENITIPLGLEAFLDTENMALSTVGSHVGA